MLTPFKPLYFPLVYSTREQVIDEVYFGCAFLFDEFSLLKKFGDDAQKSFFMRSLSKPVQASTIADFNLISQLNLTDEEIAICCASHTGTKTHTALVRSILNKAGLDESYLKCPCAIPLDTCDFDGIKKPIYHNCSAKHALMLAISKINNWDTSSYLEISHPVQKLIQKRHLELSGAKETQISLDGCGAPVFSFKINEIAKMFFNLFNDQKFSFIKNAMVKNPYIAGGSGRLDSEIMVCGKGNLAAKVGAGGFVLIYNIKENKILIIKMSQNNNLPRRIAALNALCELKWIDENPAPAHFYNDWGEKIGNYACNFSFL